MSNVSAEQLEAFVAPCRERVNAYIDAVLSGEIVTGRLVKLACRRHRDDLQHAADRGLYFDEAIAARSCAFFRILRHTTGRWVDKPFILSRSQLFITWVLMGWRRKADNLRRYRKAYISVARKWGKTTWAAGLALLLLYADSPIEARAEVYSAATKQEQACIVHTQAVLLAQACPSLAPYAKALRTGDRYKVLIVNGGRYNHSIFRPLGKDSKLTGDGSGPSAVIMDELHAWTHYYREQFNKLTSGSGNRAQPLSIVITTAGDEKSELWIERDNYATQILEAAATTDILDDTTFAFIARLDEERPCNCLGPDPECPACSGTGIIPEDDILDPANWPKANPELGETPSLDFLQDAAREAAHIPEQKRSFRRYHANMRVTSLRKPVTRELWNACRGELSDWPATRAHAFGGIDLGTRDDLASIAAVARFAEGVDPTNGLPVYRYETRQRSFIHEKAERDLSAEPFTTWITEGRLIVTPGDATSIAEIERTIVEWTKLYDVREWAFDPAQAMYLGQRLTDEYDIFAGRFPQTFVQYNEALLTLTKQLIPAKLIRHDGDGLLAWAWCNLALKCNHKQDVMPDKDASPDKIDPAVAMIMAFKLSYFEVDEGYAFSAGDSVTL
jgi:phage terminase large subunit-like protein